MFTLHMVVLPVATSSATCHPHAGAITVEANRICDHATVYLSKIFCTSIYYVS
jgi:hypothetical protein